MERRARMGEGKGGEAKKKSSSRLKKKKIGRRRHRLASHFSILLFCFSSLLFCFLPPLLPGFLSPPDLLSSTPEVSDWSQLCATKREWDAREGSIGS